MPTEKELETVEVRKVSNDFRGLILQKQAAFDDKGIDYVLEDLITGTPYEDMVHIKHSTITYTTLMDTYKWVYISRVCNTPAILIEIKGFN